MGYGEYGIDTWDTRIHRIYRDTGRGEANVLQNLPIILFHSAL